jgi:c-di-GMP-binding flagellar brake protein YcgR
MTQIIRDDDDRKLRSSDLVGCRIVLELLQDHHINTGVVNFIQGDLIEIDIEASKIDTYKLGSLVKCALYTGMGIKVFHTSIVARTATALMVLNHPVILEMLHEKREYYRVEVNEKGVIRSVRGAADNQAMPLLKPVEIRIADISQGGIKFQYEEEPGSEIAEEDLIDTKIDIANSVECTVQVTRKEVVGGPEGIVNLGAKFVNLPDVYLNSLRAYILKKQIEYRELFRSKQARTF